MGSEMCIRDRAGILSDSLSYNHRRMMDKNVANMLLNKDSDYAKFFELVPRFQSGGLSLPDLKSAYATFKIDFPSDYDARIKEVMNLLGSIETKYPLLRIVDLSWSDDMTRKSISQYINLIDNQNTNTNTNTI